MEMGGKVCVVLVCIMAMHARLLVSAERVAWRADEGGAMPQPHQLAPTAEEALRMSKRQSGMVLYRTLKARWRPRVYVYELPPGLGYKWACGGNPGRCWRETYGGELGVLHALRQAGYVTDDPETADLFFVPTYFRQAKLRVGGYHPGTHVERLIEWLRTMPWWDRRGQRDHLVSVWEDEGMAALRRFRGPNPPDLLANVTLVTFEGRHGRDGYTPEKDVNVPVMYLSPGITHSLQSPPPMAERTWGAYFQGTVWEHNPKYSRGTRRVLFEHFRSANLSQALTRDDGMIVLDRDDRSVHFSTAMQKSKFCLHLAGMGAWTPRLPQAVLSECVPVIIMDNSSQPFDVRSGGFLDYTAFSITVPDAEIPQLPEILHRVESSGKLARLQAGLRAVKHHFLFPLAADRRRGHEEALPHVEDDATDMLVYEAALKSLLRRAHAQQQHPSHP